MIRIEWAVRASQRPAGHFGRRGAHPLFTILGTSLLLTVATIALAQSPAGIRATLNTAKSSYFVGEDIALNYCVENGSGAQVKVNPDRFEPVVTDARGTVMPKPNTSVMLAARVGGGIVLDEPVAPGARWCGSFPLMTYVRIDGTGSYTVRAKIELREFTGDGAINIREGPEAQTALTLTMPTAAQAEVVLAALEAMTPPNSRRSPEYNPYDGVAMFPVVYLAPLRRRAEAGDIHAVGAIAEMPHSDAVRALIDLTAHRTAAVARAATLSLPSRLPPAIAGTAGPLGTLGGFGTDGDMTASWRGNFAADVRALAKKLLMASEPWDVRAGAFMIAAVGGSEDAPDLAAALTRAIANVPAVPLANDVRRTARGVAQELLRAAKALVGRGYTPAAPGETSGQQALWLVWLDSGRRPEGWERSIAQALAHESPYIRDVALDHMPLPIPTTLVPAVAASIASPNTDLQVAACRLADRAKLREVAEPIRQALRTTTDFWVFNECGNAVYGVGPRTELFEIAAARLAEPQIPGTHQKPAFLSVLFGLFDGTSGHGSNDAQTAAYGRALSVRWLRFIAEHRAEILAGKRWTLDDPAVTTDLVPPGTSIYRPDKPPWPPR